MKLLALLLCIPFSAQALVDYSENSEPPRAVKKNPPPVRSTARPTPSNSETTSSSKIFSLSTAYKGLTVKTPSEEAKLNVLEVSGEIQTPYSVFLEFNYWMAQTDSPVLSQNDSQQSGNSKFILGFNWLNFGDASVDLYAGLQLGSSSELARSTTDKIFGIRTGKRLGVLAFELGYEGILTDKSVTEEELAVGTIGHLYATLGWMATSDIHFAVQAGAFTVGDAREEGGLQEQQKFGHVTPVVSLMIGPNVSMNFSASFQSRKPNDPELYRARLWTLPGAYGKLLQAQLTMSL